MSRFTTWMNRQTVEARAPRRIPVLTCALVFTAMALVVGRWGHERWSPVDARPSYTATARAVETATGEVTPFSVVGTDSQRAKAAAGDQAERFIAERVAEWRRAKEESHKKSQERLEIARQGQRKSATALAAFERQRPEPVRVVAKPKPAVRRVMVDNPAWLDLQRQIADLEARRDQLLIDRTPLHPAVKEVDGRLDEVKQQLVATARQIPDERVKEEKVDNEPALLPAVVDDSAVKEFERKLVGMTGAVEKSRLALQEAERAEKQARQELAVRPQYTIERSEAVRNPPEVDYGWRRLIWTTFASSLLVVFGVAMMSLGAGIDPPIGSVEDVEDDLALPVLGVLPTGEGAPDGAAIDRQLAVRRAAITCGVILIVVGPLVAVWGVMGI